ncbi:Thymidine kinase [compost metagenome]
MSKSKLSFIYAPMNAGKSIEVLKMHHSYSEYGKKCLLFAPAMDTRFGTGLVASRIGISQKATMYHRDTNFVDQINQMAAADTDRIFAIIVEESQFLTKQQVSELAKIVDSLDIPVYCYGLKNTFQNELFEGSAALLVYADSIKEIKTICASPDCGEKATMILRLENGVPTYQGEVVQIGDNDTYKSVCRHHYYNPF